MGTGPPGNRPHCLRCKLFARLMLRCSLGTERALARKMLVNQRIFPKPPEKQASNRLQTTQQQAGARAARLDLLACGAAHRSMQWPV